MRKLLRAGVNFHLLYKSKKGKKWYFNLIGEQAKSIDERNYLLTINGLFRQAEESLWYSGQFFFYINAGNFLVIS